MSQLRDIRRHRGFKAYEIAKLVDLTPPAFSTAENRRYAVTPKTATIRDYARANLNYVTRRKLGRWTLAGASRP